MRLILALAGILIAQAAAAQDAWNIGVIAPTTGPLSTVGVRQQSAVQWWAQDVNAKGGIKGKKVNIIPCNDDGSPEKSVTCTRNLLDQHIVLLLNASVSGPIQAVMPLVADKGPVMVTPSPNLSPSPSSYVFQTSPAVEDHARAIANFVKNDGGSLVGILAATDTSGEVGIAQSSAIFDAAGIKHEASRIDLRANDATIQLSQITQNKPALIYSIYSGGGAATVVKSYANLGLKVPLLVSYANVTDAFIDLIKNDMPSRLLAVGLKAAAPALIQDPKEREHVEYFEKAYKAWKGENADHLSLLGLTMADFAAAVLENVPNPSDPAAVKQYVETHPIPSVSTMHFSSKTHVGFVADDMTVLEYKKDHWEKAATLK